MNSLIWFDSRHRIGRARFTGTFSMDDDPCLFARFKEIFKGKEPCNLLIDIPEGDDNVSKGLFDWLAENAWKLNLDKIAVIETCPDLGESDRCIDEKRKDLRRQR